MANNAFWFLAGIMTATAAACVLLPLYRRVAAHHGARWRGAALLGAAMLLAGGGALGLYRLWSSPGTLKMTPGETAMMAGMDAQPAGGEGQHVGSVQEAAQKLEQRLRAQGGSPAEWNLLAQSYDFLGRGAEAAEARKHAESPAGSAAAALTPAAAQPAADTEAKTGGVQITGTVDIDPKVRGRAAAGSTMYVFAKAADSPGPPLAVFRTTVDRWPVAFSLDDSQAMLPQRKLSDFRHVKIEARIAAHGQPLAQSGDLQGSSAILDSKSEQPVHVLIDKIIG